MHLHLPVTLTPRWGWMFSILLWSACGDSTPEPGEWYGHAAVADNQLMPIRAYLDLTAEKPTGYFITRDERTEIPEIVYTGDSLRLIFAEYGAEMAGRISHRGYAGKYLRFRDDTTSFPFVLFSTPLPKTDSIHKETLVGTYDVVLHYPDRIDSSSIGVISLDGGKLAGTIIHPSGDYGLLEGHHDSTGIQFSRFTGWQAILLDLEESDDGLDGNLYVRADEPVPVSFLPAASGARAHGAITHMRNPNATFSFAGVTIDGDSLSSEDPRFDGKPIVIDIMGTWCHNCLDAAPLLERAYEEHREAGLEIISLSFENSEDFRAAQRNIGLFSQRFETSFPVLFCGSLAEDNVNARLNSQLENFFSYPTTLFIDRTGKVVDIHTGFNGPGTGNERYQEQIRRFEQAVLRIVGGTES